MEEWVKKTETLIRESMEIPMWGNMPNFPWEDFTTRMRNVLGLEDLNIEVGEADWKDSDQILSGFGKEAHTVGLMYTPLTEEMFLALPKEDLSRLTSWVYDEKSFTDPDLAFGFFQYVTLHAIDQARSFQILHGLSPRMTGSPLATTEAYCIDIALSAKDETIWGRIICPKPFHSAFKTHFESHPVDLATLQEAANLPMTLTLEGGFTELEVDTWKGVNAGDLVLLDRATYKPSGAGSILLKLGEHPLVYVTLKNGEMKVLDYALAAQEKPMEEAQPEEMHPQEAAAEPAPPPPQVDMSEVPLKVSIELARIEMSAKDVLTLKPGNSLPLGIETAQAVTLTVSGKAIGKGELIEMGDHVGVKILSLSDGE